ncbi:MAG TPA: 4Fe-4S binding protein [Clostridia bacterium]|nr:4Fe-4S binding protein [Clostridia bacterium]
MAKKQRMLIILVALVLLWAGIVHQRLGSREHTLVLLQEVFPAAVSYQPAGGKYPAYRVLDEQQRPVGYAVLAQASGYGGPLTVLVGLDAGGKVVRVQITRHHETPLYLKLVLEEGFLERFYGKTFGDPLVLGQDLDGVSGATVSAQGIAAAVGKAVRQVGVEEFGLALPEPEPAAWGAEEWILLAMFVTALVGMKYGWTKMRGALLAFSVFFLGFRLGASLNLGNIASLISGNVPAFPERPSWHLLVGGTLLVVLGTGRNWYCAWLCPFGAVQEGIHRVLSLLKYPVPRRYLAWAVPLRLTLTWLALLLAFLFVNPSIAGYEPFAAFFSGRAHAGQWLLMGLVLFLSLFYYRLWCRFFCPTGAVLDLAAAVRGRIKGRKEREKKHAPAAGEEGLACPRAPRCGGLPRPDQETKDPPGVFPWVLGIFVALILFTLLKNAGVL